MSADTRIETNAVNNLLSIQPLHLSVGIQLIEIANTQSQIGVGEQLNSFSLCESHKQGIDILLDSTFLQKFSKSVCCLHQSSIIHVGTNNDTGRIKVVVQSLTLTQKFRAKNDVVTVELLSNACCITNWDGALDNHNGFRIVFDDQFDYSFNCTGIKEIFLAIVICRCSDNYKISITVCFLGIQCCSQIQLFFCQIFLNIFVLNR